MVLREIDAQINILKKLIVFLSFSLLVNIVYAQNDNFGFQKDFIRHFRYPGALRNACTATIANINIEVSETGAIKNISISDSAPKFFRDKFNGVKGSLNTAPLDSLISQKKLRNCSIIIAVFYVYSTDWCVNSFEPVGAINDNYLVFNGKLLDNMTYNIKPIVIIMGKPMY